MNPLEHATRCVACRQPIPEDARNARGLCDDCRAERDEPTVHERGELPERDGRDEHDRTL